MPGQAELQKMKQQAAESKAYIDSQEAEERKLLKIIAEADADRLRQFGDRVTVSVLLPQLRSCWGCLTERKRDVRTPLVIFR